MKYAILLLLLIPLTTALSVSPATKDVILTEEYTYELRITHENNHETRIELIAENIADIPESILIPPNTTYTLPIRLQPLRNQQASITLQQEPQEQSMLTAGAAVRHTIRYTTPQQGTHLTAHTITSALIPQEPVHITTRVHNTGTEPLTAVRSTHTIYDTQQRELTSTNTESITLTPAERRTLSTSWTPPQPGRYTLHVQTRYNNQTITEHINLEVGQLVIIAKEPQINLLDQETVLITIPVQNTWNEELRAHATIQLMRDERTIHSTQTPTETLHPERNTTLQALIRDVQEGTYLLRATIHYAHKTLSIERTVHIDYSTTPKRLLWLERGALILLIITLIYEYKRRRSGNKTHQIN